MSITLGDVKTEMRAMIGRGAALDASLWGFISKSIIYVERQRNFNHMLHLHDLVIDPAAPQPRVINFTPLTIKSIEFFRLVLPTNACDFFYLQNQVDPTKQVPAKVAQPKAYRRFQNTLLHLDNTPDIAYSAEISSFHYTDLPKGDTTQHHFFDFFEDGIMHFAMYYACKFTRDGDRAMKEFTWGKDALDGLIAAEEDAEWLDSDLVMEVPIDH